MQDAGFFIGDKIFVKMTNPKDLKIGVYIAFYQSKFITFITSPIGIVSLVAIPCSLVITVDVYQLIIYSYQYRQLLKSSNLTDPPEITNNKLKDKQKN